MTWAARVWLINFYTLFLGTLATHQLTQFLKPKLMQENHKHFLAYGLLKQNINITNTLWRRERARNAERITCETISNISHDSIDF